MYLNTSRIFEAYEYKPKADSLLRINDQVGQNVALSISNSIEQKLKSLKDIKGNSHESNLKLSSIRSILQALDTQVDWNDNEIKAAARSINSVKTILENS